MGKTPVNINMENISGPILQILRIIYILQYYNFNQD